MVTKKRERLEEGRGKISQSKKWCFSCSGFPAYIHLSCILRSSWRLYFGHQLLNMWAHLTWICLFYFLACFGFFFLIHALESITTDTLNAANLITPLFEKVLPFTWVLFSFGFLVFFLVGFFFSCCGFFFSCCFLLVFFLGVVFSWLFFLLLVFLGFFFLVVFIFLGFFFLLVFFSFGWFFLGFKSSFKWQL